jgi:small subunit ribosomal protein S20
MPNIKSAEKRVRVIEKKTLENKMIRSQMNTVIKKFNAAVSANDIPLAEKLLPNAMSRIDAAAVAGVIHKNNANNKKANLSRTLHQLKSGKIVVKLDAKTAKQNEQKAAGAAKKQAEADRVAAREAAKAEKTPAALKAKEKAAKEAEKADKKAKKEKPAKAEKPEKKQK